MDPPGQTAPNQRHPPQPFEIALIRKIESKTSSVRDAFLLLDADGDGRIKPSDIRTVLHNEMGLDITKEQEECLFSRLPQQQNKENFDAANNGMGYGAFAKYFQEVSSAVLPASQSGMAAAVGFHRDDDGTSTKEKDREMPIHLQTKTILHQRRHQLRQLFTAHSSRVQGSGMKETSLFLAMDVHRSGKVTMQELIDWLKSVGLDWTMEELKQVVLGDSDGIEKENMESRLFRESDDNGEGEAGMTEHEFALFVESLDCE
mmetsp:Transcript_37413/g.78908  ORF Transcript_37413/g.78908 Transcript_37413/m.78908 type:complete len:260 (+) Transcript_37413:54-833(+)